MTTQGTRARAMPAPERNGSERPIADALTLRTVEGWVVGQALGEDEPRVRDLELAERLGFERPRDIRKLIERHQGLGNLNDFDIRATVARVATGVATREATEYWLTEAGALWIATKSETPAAAALTKEMIRVFMLARRGALPAPATPEAALAGRMAQSLAAGDQAAAARDHAALGVLLGAGAAAAAVEPPTRSAAPRARRPPPRDVAPGSARERVLDFIMRETAAGRRVKSVRAVRRGVPGRHTVVHAALKELLADGTILRTPAGFVLAS